MMVMVQQVQYHPKLQHVLLCDDVDQTHQDHPHQELKRRHWWEERSERSMPVSMDRNFVPPIGALSLFRTRDNPWDTNLADHIWHHSLYAPHESAETMWGGQKRHDLQCLLLSSWKQVWLKILLQGSPWDIMSVLTCQQRPKVDMEPTDSAHCLFFQPWSGHKFHPQLILSSCGGKKKQKDTWQEIPTLNEILDWHSLQSADVHASPVSSDTPIANPVVFVPPRFARWSTWHEAASPPSLCWVGVLNTSFLLGTVLLHWVQLIL